MYILRIYFSQKLPRKLKPRLVIVVCVVHRLYFLAVVFVETKVCTCIPALLYCGITYCNKCRHCYINAVKCKYTTLAEQCNNTTYKSYTHYILYTI